MITSVDLKEIFNGAKYDLIQPRSQGLCYPALGVG